MLSPSAIKQYQHAVTLVASCFYQLATHFNTNCHLHANFTLVWCIVDSVMHSVLACMSKFGIQQEFVKVSISYHNYTKLEKTITQQVLCTRFLLVLLSLVDSSLAMPKYYHGIYGLKNINNFLFITNNLTIRLTHLPCMTLFQIVSKSSITLLLRSFHHLLTKILSIFLIIIFFYGFLPLTSNADS